MITVFKVLHGLIGISPNDVGLTLCTNNTRAGGLRLQQQHIRTYATANLFMFRAAREYIQLLAPQRRIQRYFNCF